MAFMRIDCRAVAMQLAALVGRRLWLLTIGYSEDVVRCSPGNLLMLEVVHDAAEQGIASIESLDSPSRVQKSGQTLRELTQTCHPIRSTRTDVQFWLGTP